MDWDYSSIRGQHKWGEHCKIGNSQSPIDIIHDNTTFDDTLESNPLKRNQKSPIKMQALNKGVNISITPTCDALSLPNISGGPLGHVYTFKECHFHWGRSVKPGSEHLLNGKRTHAELHLVHQKSQEKNPLDLCDGLSVLGIRLNILENAQTDPVLKALLDLFNKVPYKTEESQYDGTIDLYSLLDTIFLNYYTYNGSLTTPPLSECVKWIVFSEPLNVSAVDFKAFESVFSVNRNDKSEKFYDPFSKSDNCSCASPPKIGDNFREPCDLNGRDIRRSFK